MVGVRWPTPPTGRERGERGAPVGQPWEAWETPPLGQGRQVQEDGSRAIRGQRLDRSARTKDRSNKTGGLGDWQPYDGCRFRVVGDHGQARITEPFRRRKCAKISYRPHRQYCSRCGSRCFVFIAESSEHQNPEPTTTIKKGFDRTDTVSVQICCANRSHPQLAEGSTPRAFRGCD